jgi:hypothetical protein
MQPPNILEYVFKTQGFECDHWNYADISKLNFKYPFSVERIIKTHVSMHHGDLRREQKKLRYERLRVTKGTKLYYLHNENENWKRTERWRDKYIEHILRKNRCMVSTYIESSTNFQPVEEETIYPTAPFHAVVKFIINEDIETKEGNTPIDQILDNADIPKTDRDYHFIVDFIPEYSIRDD